VPEKITKSIFVVDDEHLIAETLTEILKSSGFRARGFESANAAIQAAELEAPDLLITDVSMPEVNGIELAIRFESLYPKCKILLFSGQLSTIDLLTADHLADHEFEILAKPVHPRELLAAIRAL
jgi:DNA-binding response OmpR family regulator